MKSKALYRLARRTWYATLLVQGFTERNGAYLRIFDSGVVHQLALDKDPHGAETFRVMCGVDAVQLKEGAGPSYAFKKYDGLCHLTPKGWDYNSGRWPCETEDEACASLIALLPLVLELALPWLDPISTLSDVGNEINEVRNPGLGWMKARLYGLDGNFARACDAIERYAAWAAKPRNWGTRELQLEDLERAARIRQEIEEAKSTPR